MWESLTLKVTTVRGCIDQPQPPVKRDNGPKRKGKSWPKRYLQQKNNLGLNQKILIYLIFGKSQIWGVYGKLAKCLN